MKKPDNQPDDLADKREHIIGLGEKSIRKSYYPELQERLADLERFKTLLDQSNDAIFLIDVPSGLLLYVNKAVCTQIGYAEEECYSLTLYNIFPENTTELDKIFSGETDSIIFNCLLEKRSGEKSPYELNMHLVTFKKRKYVVAIARDFTEHMRAEKVLRESEEKFRALAESSAAAILVYQGEYIVSVNPAAELITGYPKNELLKRRIIDNIHPDFKDLVLKRALARQRGEPEPYQYEIKIITRSGEVKWVLISVGLMMYRGKPAGVATLLDITERKRAEDTLRESERNLAQAQAISHVGNWNINLVTEVGTVSDEYFRILGIPRQDIFPFSDFIKLVHPDDRPRVQAYFNEAIIAHKMASFDFRIVRPNGEERIVTTFGEFVVDREGEPCMFGTVQDVTERRLAEKELTDAKAKAELYLDLMSHDITNMNQALMGYLELMEALQETGKIDKALVDNSIEIINRSSRMINDVKKLTRLQTGKVPLIDLDICKMLAVVKARYSSVPNRRVTINYTPGENCIVRAGDLLDDVFDNLADNAIRHSSGPVTIDLTVDRVFLERSLYYRITVADNGPGISDNLKRKIFAPIEEIGERAERRGFGLYLVKTVVDFYHGRVCVEDRVPGDYTKGAKFIILLPMAYQPSSAVGAFLDK